MNAGLSRKLSQLLRWLYKGMVATFAWLSQRLLLHRWKYWFGLRVCVGAALIKLFWSVSLIDYMFWCKNSICMLWLLFCEESVSSVWPYAKRRHNHSLTSRPSSMRVGDSRWSLRYLLHCARSCDISFSWMYLQPVHSSVSCIHCLLGLPWCHSPSMIPSRTVSANCPALPRVMWPKFCKQYIASIKLTAIVMRWKV